MAASGVSNPQDVIKVRQQLRTHLPGGQKNAFWAVGAEMARTEGVRSMMNGFTASMLREVFYSGLRLGGYEFFKDKYVGVICGRLYTDRWAVQVL